MPPCTPRYRPFCSQDRGRVGIAGDDVSGGVPGNLEVKDEGLTSAEPSWLGFPAGHPAPKSVAHMAYGRAQEGPVCSLRSASENSWAFDLLGWRRCRSWRHRAWK